MADVELVRIGSLPRGEVPALAFLGPLHRALDRPTQGATNHFGFVADKRGMGRMLMASSS